MTDIEQLKKEHDREEAMEASFHSPYKLWIEHVFKDLYPGRKYRSTTLIEMKMTLVKELLEMQEKGTVKNLTNKIARIKSIGKKEALLFFLEDELFKLQ